MTAADDIINILNGSSVIGLASRINPDGDSVGSLLCLGMILRRLGKRPYASLPEPGSYPPQYLFLPGKNMLITPEDFNENIDVFVALDCSNPERLGPLREKFGMAISTVNIDHHEDNNFYASINLVDEKASSTAEIVFSLFKTAGWEMEIGRASCRERV